MFHNSHVRHADFHVSLCQVDAHFSWRARESAHILGFRTHSSHGCLSARVPAFAEPDIHSLSQATQGRHRRLSLCSLPVPKQFGESLGSLISFAQSATAGPGSLRTVES